MHHRKPNRRNYAEHYHRRSNRIWRMRLSWAHYCGAPGCSQRSAAADEPDRIRRWFCYPENGKCLPVGCTLCRRMEEFKKFWSANKTARVHLTLSIETVHTCWSGGWDWLRSEFKVSVFVAHTVIITDYDLLHTVLQEKMPRIAQRRRPIFS